jgi:polysaccharide chain length determinant protein (PEP-CTERM system associated)
MSQLEEAPDSGFDVRQIADLVLGYLRGVWRFRWWALATAWIVSLAGWAYVSLLPDSYVASTRVYVDTESLLRPLLSGLSVDTNIMNDLSVMTRTMLSRPSLERVARETDLDLTASTDREKEALIRELENNVTISRSRENIYNIAYTDANRETALAVVKTLLDVFVEDTLGTKQEDSVQAERTLKAQIDEYEARLNEADNRLKDFKQKNIGMMPSDRGDYYAQLQEAMKELASAREKLQVAQRKRDALQRQLVGEEPVLGIMGDSISGGDGRRTSYDAHIAQLESNLNELRLQYTDKHPEVVRTLSLLKELYAKRDEQLAQMPDTDEARIASNPLDANPVYQNLKIQLGTAEVDVASLKAELEQRQANVDRLRNLVDVIPEVEAQMNRLNRDYNVVRSRYEEMLKRWENLQTSQYVRNSSESIKFRIIDPPFAATRPAGPDRTLLGVMSAAFGIGVAVGLAVLIHLFFPVFHTTTELVRQFDLPLLGTVSLTDADQGIVRSNWGFFVGVGALGIATLCAIVLAEPLSTALRGFV